MTGSAGFQPALCTRQHDAGCLPVSQKSHNLTRYLPHG